MGNHLKSLIIGIAIVLTALIFSLTIINLSKQRNAIYVTGLGSKDFTSDLIVWNGTFHRKSMVLKEAYAALDADRESIKTYLVGKGITARELIFSAVDIQKEFDEDYDDYGNKKRSTFTGYRLTQQVQIKSGQVDQVEAISRQVSELINSGIEFYSQAPEYYYTKLAELKLEMISEATKDANERAVRIATQAGSAVGNLKSADMGVFQITAQNSSEDYSWGGSFNTSSKDKTASITVKLSYETE